MLKEFVEKLLQVAAPQTLLLNGLSYTDRALSVVAPPMLSTVPLLTLTGLVDLVKAKTDDLKTEGYLLHVCSHTKVQLVSKYSDGYGRRTVLASSICDDGQSFAFGKFMEREEFVIGLQSRFVSTEALLGVLKVASNLEASIVTQSEDDGISQRTTVKQGIALKETVTIKGRVKLAPYRTFREVEQPESEFVFRLRSNSAEIPACALYEADGGKWKLDAVEIIKRWLVAQNLNIPVIA